MEFTKYFKSGERYVVGLSDAGDVVIRPNHISVHIDGSAHAMFYDPPTWNGLQGAVFKASGVEFDLEMDEQTFKEMKAYVDWVRE